MWGNGQLHQIYENSPRGGARPVFWLTSLLAALLFMISLRIFLVAHLFLKGRAHEAIFPPWNQGFIDLFFYCQFAFRLKPTTASLEPCPSKKISCENENLNFKNFVWKTWKFTFFWFVSIGTFEPKYYLKFVCRALLCYGFVQCIKWSNRSSHSPL